MPDVCDVVKGTLISSWPERCYRALKCSINLPMSRAGKEELEGCREAGCATGSELQSPNGKNGTMFMVMTELN